MVNGNLPDGWTWSTIGELAERVTKGSTPTSYGFKYQREGIRFVKTENIVENGAIQHITDYIDDETNSFLNRSILQPYDILFSIAGTIGRVGIVQEKDVPANTNQALAILRGVHKRANYKYVFYFLKSPFIQKQALDSIVGVGRANLSLVNVGSLQIPLPPLPEQERIVAKIEELFTQLEAGTSALKRVRAGLKRYKASVLKAACEGQLFGDVELGNDGLPADWKWIKVKDAGKVQLGRQRAPKHHEGPHMRPYLRVANVFEDRLDLSDVKEMNFTPAEYEIYKLEYGDILLNEGQSPELLGRPAMYKGELPGGCFQNTLIRFQAFDFVDRQFALFVFRHYMHAGRFTNESQITTNIAHLSAGRFSEIEFPLPPLAEQRRIVAEVERRLSVAQEVESVVAASVARATRLRQSVLKSAFEGRLGT